MFSHITGRARVENVFQGLNKTSVHFNATWSAAAEGYFWGFARVNYPKWYCMVQKFKHYNNMPISGPVKFAPKVSANVSQDFRACAALSDTDDVGGFDDDNWDEDYLNSIGVAADASCIKIEID